MPPAAFLLSNGPSFLHTDSRDEAITLGALKRSGARAGRRSSSRRASPCRDGDGDGNESPVGASADQGGEKRDKDRARPESAWVVDNRHEPSDDRTGRHEVGDEVGGRGSAGEPWVLRRAQRDLAARDGSVSAERTRRRSGEPCGRERRPDTGGRGRRGSGPRPPLPKLSLGPPDDSTGGSLTDHQMT